MSRQSTALQPPRSWRAAFNVFELLVVLAVLALLASLGLPALAKSQSQTKITQCAGNLRQFGLAMLIYGDENNDRLPQQGGGSWPWDLPVGTSDNLARYGATRPQMYCPGFPDQNNETLWTFSTYRVIGYAMTLPGTSTLIATNWNPTLTQPYLHLFGQSLGPQPPSTRVLLADVILSKPGQTTTANKLTYTYTGIVGGGPVTHRTSHMNQRGNYPLGGNLAMVDGHVEWRQFQDVISRTPNGASPGWWW